MNKEARLNLLFFGIFLFAIVILSMYFVSGWRSNVLNSNGIEVVNYSAIGGQPINEDVGQIYNISINHTGGNKQNITNVSIYLWGNFDLSLNFQSIITGSNGTSLNDTFVHTSPWFSNTSSTLVWNGTNSTNYVIPGNITTNNSWFRFNATAATPGKYNITVRISYNVSSNYNETNISVHINDTTKPFVVNVTGPNLNRSYANVSGTLVINISADDNGNLTAGGKEYDVTGVNISFYNISRVINASYLASNVTNKFWNVSVNTATLPDGVYNITIIVNDTKNNINITNISNIRIDNTVPSASVSCTPATVNSGDIVTCSCTPSDVTSGINSTATSIVANPSTANTGTFTETCGFADMAGNIGSASATYNVEMAGGGGSGGSGSSSTTSFTYSKTIPQTSQDFSEIKVIETSSFGGGGLKVKERVKIKLNEEEHYIGIRELTATSATIEITSDPVQVKLGIGEDKKVDIDDDGIYDLHVKLNGITGSVADLTINYLQEEIPEGEGAVSTTGEEVTGEEEEKDMTWLWILIIALVLAIIIGAGIAAKKKK